MKSIIHYSVLLLTLLILASCGGPKNTKASFVVSRGFALVNSSYDGGLTIYGKNLSTNETFSYASLPNGGSNSIVLDLQKGNWSFSVVGWSGATLNKPLTGTPFCDHIASTSLNSDAATISLTPTNPKCAGLDFASPNMQSGNMLKTMTIHACHSLAGASGGADSSFCSTKMSDTALGDKIYGLKLRLHSQPLPGTSAGAPVETACIKTSNLGYFNLTGYQIPTKNFPFHIQTYRDEDCNIASSTYPLVNGMEYNYTNFKTVAINTDPILFIASTRSKSDISPFTAILPEIKCSGASCSTIKNLPSGVDFVITGGATGPSQRIILSKTKGCDHFTSITATPPLELRTDCEQEDEGHAVIEVGTTAAGSCITNPGCDLTYQEDGTNVTKKVLALVDTPPTDFKSQAIKFQEMMWEMLGVSQNNIPLGFSFGWVHPVDTNFGILGDVREMLGPHGPGGAFNDFATCTDAVGTRYIDAYDDGVLRNFQIQITNISESIPRQICPVTLGGDGSCSATFDKKIILRNAVNGIYYTTEVLKVDCQNKAGQSETYYSHADTDGKEYEKGLVYWNTQDEIKTRVEDYSYDLEYNPDNTIRSVRTEVKTISVENLNASNQLVFRRDRYEFSGNERIERDEFFYASNVSGNMVTSTKSYSPSINTSLGQIFTMPEFQLLQKEKSNHANDLTIGNIRLLAISPNGLYRISASTANTSSIVDFKASVNGAYKSGVGSLVSAFDIGDVAVNDQGQAIFMYVPSGGASIYYKKIDLTSADPFSVIDTPIDDPISGSQEKIRLSLDNNSIFSYAVKAPGGEVRFGIKDYNTGLNAVGNYLPNGIGYIVRSIDNVLDFDFTHSNGYTGRFCYTLATLYKCKTIRFPNSPVPTITNSGNFNTPITIGQQTSTFNLSANSLSPTTGTIYFSNSPSCAPVLGSSSVSAGMSSTTLTGLMMGLHQIYYKIDTGACTSTGITFYVWDSETDERSNAYGTPMILGRGYYDQTNDKFVTTISDNGILKLIKYDASQAQEATTAGMNLQYHTQDLAMPLGGLIDASVGVSAGGIDTDQLDAPIVYPKYKSQLKDLNPNDFNLIFTNTTSFTAQ